MSKPIMFRCSCQTHDHHFLLSPDHEERIVYLSSHLSPKPLLHRIGLAIKYIFGFRSRFGDYSEVILEEEQWKELRDSLSKFEEELNCE